MNSNERFIYDPELDCTLLYRHDRLIARQWYNNGVLIKEIIYDTCSTSTLELWRHDDKRHRDNAPAVIEYDIDGNVIRKKWYQHDKLHNTNGPAYIYYENGKPITEEWYYDGKFHRDNAPAVIECDSEGNVIREKWYQHGELHNTNGPAYICYKNRKLTFEGWYQHGKRHRIGGPAHIDRWGNYCVRAWYINDEQIEIDDVISRGWYI